MSQIEKLRALLAEARETLSLHDGVVECDHPECRLYRFFDKGIDAALAEPAAEESLYGIREDRDSLRVEIKRLERERDEARAEIDRICEEHAQRFRAGFVHLLDERDEARAEVERLRMALGHFDNAMRVVNDSIRAAYQRGAEAMREAAASCVLDSARFWSAQYVADDIRALPVPEDEP